jgi:hypothetical protein
MGIGKKIIHLAMVIIYKYWYRFKVFQIGGIAIATVCLSAVKEDDLGDTIHGRLDLQFLFLNGKFLAHFKIDMYY